MRKYAIAMLALVAALSFSACDNNGDSDDRNYSYKPISVDDQTRSSVAKNNEFAFEFFRAAIGDSESNSVVSPIGVMQVLTMFANGDDGESRDEVLRILGYKAGADNLEALNSYCRLLNEQLPKVDPSTKCRIVNSIWHADNISFFPEYVDKIGSVNGCEVINKSPMGESGRKAINKWVDKKTSGMIPEFLKSSYINEFAMLNATCFNGKWKDKFDKKDTSQRRFYNLDGSTSMVQMMYQSNDDAVYYEDDNVEAVTKSYGSTNFQMIAIMPKEHYEFEAFCNEIDNALVEMIMSDSYFGVKTQLRFPQFSSISSQDLYPVLIEMGLSADNKFRKMCDKTLTLTMMPHAVRIEVDEGGTEAASATMGGGVTAPGPGINEIEFNRPFVYLIQERSTGAILFTGKVVNL